ncbi:MAG: hypothetical protein GY861_12350 [bacterium]|nr:hypothetical protein [bacterium]
MDPEEREKYVDVLLELDGLSHIKEDTKAAYCPISLTSTPNELKESIKLRQKILMEDVLGVAGITAYDPGSAPYSPDTNLTSQPNEIYVVDSGKIVGARFFVGHNILPSTGQGIEAEKAKVYNRMAVMLMDQNMRVSRMQPHRAIYLQYDNFQTEAEKFIPVFEMLQSYEPGMGFNDELPVLLGFEKHGTGIVDLEEAVYREFPDLQYKYDGHTPILKLRSENPELFYENIEISP